MVKAPFTLVIGGFLLAKEPIYEHLGTYLFAEILGFFNSQTARIF